MKLAEVDTEALLGALNALPDKIAKSIKASAPSSPSAGDGGGSGGSGIDISLPKGRKGGLLTDTAETAMSAVGLAGNDLSSSISGFAENITNFGGLVSDLAGAAQYLDDTANVFQSISKVGAGLNGDLGALRATAAQARLPLDSFANIVANNAEQLAAFGGGVEEGAKRAAQLGNAMFETGAIDGFMNLGYSIEEANEFVVENTELIRRQSRLQNMTAAQEVAAATELAKQFDIVAKLTGKSAKAQQDDLVSRQRAGATQAKLRLLEMDGITGAQEAYTAAQSELKAGPKVLQDLFDDIVQTGVPMTEATKNFAATNAAAFQLAKDAKAALDRGDTAEAERLSQEAVAATAKQASSRQGLTLATLGGISEIAATQANVLEETAPLIDAIASRADQMGEVLGETVTHAEVFRDMLADLSSTQTDQIEGELAGQEAQQLVNESRQAIANANSEISQAIGENVSTSQRLTTVFSKIADTFEEQLGPQSEGIKDLGRVVEESLSTIGFGDQISNQIEIAREQGTIDEATAEKASKLAAVFEDVTKSAAERTAAMKELESLNLGVAIQEAISQLPTRREISEQVEAEGGGPRDDDRSWWDRIKESVGDFFEPVGKVVEDRKVNATGTSTNNVSAAPIEAEVDTSAVAATEIDPVKVDMDTSTIQTTPVIPDFSSMVVSNMTPKVDKMTISSEDNMSPKIDQLGTTIQGLTQQLASSPDSPDMQKNMLDKLDSLDQTMQQLVAINNEQHKVGEKQYKQTRANGRDVFTGIG